MEASFKEGNKEKPFEELDEIDAIIIGIDEEEHAANDKIRN